MVKYEITQIQLAWIDNGKKMFNVYVTDGGKNRAYYRTFARDELDAYTQIKDRLAKEQW